MKQAKYTSPVKRSLLFSLACTLVALTYCSYRIYVVVGPQGAYGLATNLQNSDRPLSCFEEDMGDEPPPQGQQTFISAPYQQFIQKQTAQSANLLTNVSLERVDQNSGQPIGYYWLSTNDSTTYSYERERGVSMPFLRVKTAKVMDSTAPAIGWITDTAPVKADNTYAYTFSYRTTVPIEISIEYTLPNNTKAYEAVTNLAATNEWQRFTHYIHNTRGATAFRFIITSHDAGQVDTRDYNIYQIANAALDQGMVSITFDDGWQSIADHALPVLDRYGFKSTQYIIGETVERHVSRYMSADTLRDIHSHGHEIGSHSLSHCDQTQLANTEILGNVTKSKELLAQSNLGPINSFAFPYGKYDDNTQPLIARAFPLLRSSDSGYNDRYFDSRNIRTMAVSAATTDQTFNSWLEYAKKHKVWLVITYHQVGEKGTYNVSTEQFTHQVEQIKNSGLRVLPVSEAAHAIRP